MTGFIRDHNQRSSKYFQIYVPTYDGGSSSAFWRIGKNPKRGDPTTDGGTSMADKFAQFAVDNHTSHTRVPSGAGTDKTPFMENLGWRDHTDGNRLTTTSGDKVEVIGGSYQMIVCDGNVIMDASGGVIWESDMLPSLVTKIHSDGSKIVERIWENGQYFGHFHGEYWERQTGSKNMQIIGNPVWEAAGFEAAPADTHPIDGDPAVYDGVWATTFTGITHANAIVDKTKAEQTLTSLVEAGTTLSDTTKAATLNEFSTATTSYKSVISADGSSAPVPTVTEEVYAGTLNSTTTAQTLTETINANSYTENFSGSNHSSTISATTVQEYLYAANLFSLSLASRVAINVTESLDIVLLSHREIHAGGFMEMTIGWKQDIVLGKETELNGTKDWKGLKWWAVGLAILLG
jgi:hypothetical protein